MTTTAPDRSARHLPGTMPRLALQCRSAGRHWLVTLPLACAALAGPALAQTGGAPAQTRPPLPPAPPEVVEPAPRDADRVPGGILRPPAGVDPGIHAPAPNPTPNTTPVIPPPGTPGGNPTVQPR
jgi:hypothetical protein